MHQLVSPARLGNQTFSHVEWEKFTKISTILFRTLFRLDQLLRSQLNESRVKNELLEQALRVIAQENLDLELKKIREGKATRSSSQNVSPLPMSHKASTEEEEEALDEVENESCINSDLDEFFDIGKS